MATIIRPEDGRTWDVVFPEAYADSEGETLEGEEGKALVERLGRSPKWYTLSNILYLLAAYYSRGKPEIKAKDRARVWVMNILITSFVNDRPLYDYDDDKDMAGLGRNVWWLVKALDTDPHAYREFGRFANQPEPTITIGEPRDNGTS